MTTQPRRRWFRFAFSLRTLFVVVTVLACALGALVWQLHIVGERRALFAELEQMTTDEDCLILYWQDCPVRENPHIPQESPAPRIRRWLGDRWVDSIEFFVDLDPQFIQRIEHAFPEAVLRAGNAYRDSLLKPSDQRDNNVGTLFKTGLIEKSSEADGKP